jgi:mannosyl-3-phosphoglycerate phosphatase
MQYIRYGGEKTVEAAVLPPLWDWSGEGTGLGWPPMEKRKTTARMRPRARGISRLDSPEIAVFTAMDGTLLDSETFSPGEAADVVRRLHAAGVPVIPVTVMTLEEIEPVATELGIRGTMILEGGGAIARWGDSAWDVEACGPPAETLLDVVREIEDRSGADLAVYSVLPDEEAARISGRSGAMLRGSLHRCFSEPFVISSGSVRDVMSAAASLGFSVRRGRRFFHLCRECDKGEAFARVREEMACSVAIGVGGSMIDAEFLTRADVPIVVPRPDGSTDGELLRRVPSARLAPAPGPQGWAQAVEDAWWSLSLANSRAPRV